jgi:hypothetical protein
MAVHQRCKRQAQLSGGDRGAKLVGQRLHRTGAAESVCARFDKSSSMQERTETPILWDDGFRANELRGSPVLDEARGREAALRAEWTDIASFARDSDSSSSSRSGDATRSGTGESGETGASTSGRSESGGGGGGAAVRAGRDFLVQSSVNEAAFLDAVAVVLAHAIYLPSAGCFALLPLVSSMRRTGNGNGCDADFDAGALAPAELCFCEREFVDSLCHAYAGSGASRVGAPRAPQRSVTHPRAKTPRGGVVQTAVRPA